MSLYSVIGVNGDRVDCYRNGKKVSKPCYLVSGFRVMDIETTEFFDVDMGYLRNIDDDLLLNSKLLKLLSKIVLIVSDINLIHYKVEDDNKYIIKREYSLFKYGICFVNGKLIHKIKESDCLLYSGEFNNLYCKVFYPYKMEIFNCILYSRHHLKCINGDLHMKFIICSNGKVGHIKKECDFCSIKDDKFDKLMELSFSSGVNGMLKLDNTYILDCSDIVEIDNLVLPSDCVVFYYFTGSVTVKVKNIIFPPNCVGVYSGDMLDNNLDIGSCYISDLVDDSIKNSIIRLVTECSCKNINFY